MRRLVYLFTCVTCITAAEQTKFALVRYQSNGAIDATFGSSGKVSTKFNDPATQAGLSADLYDIALFPSSSNAVAVGTAGNFAAIASYTGTGAPNPAFNGTGTMLLHLMRPALFSTPGPNARSVANAVAIKGGKIIVVGSFEGDVCSLSSPSSCVTWPKRFAIARFNSDGTLDQTFGVNGRLNTSFADYGPGCPESEATAVTIDAANRIVVGGTALCSGKDKKWFAVVRYDANGNPDATFGASGGRAAYNLVPQDHLKFWLYVAQTIRSLTTDSATRARHWARVRS
jgi:uncharacterized delta-60 repeat protein